MLFLRRFSVAEYVLTGLSAAPYTQNANYLLNIIILYNTLLYYIVMNYIIKILHSSYNKYFNPRCQI